MISLGREPAGGSDVWPRSGIAGLRPLAGDGASRRPKAVSSPRFDSDKKMESRGAATENPTPTSLTAYLSPPPGAHSLFGLLIPGAYAPG